MPSFLDFIKHLCLIDFCKMLCSDNHVACCQRCWNLDSGVFLVSIRLVKHLFCIGCLAVDEFCGVPLRLAYKIAKLFHFASCVKLQVMCCFLLLFQRQHFARGFFLLPHLFSTEYLLQGWWHHCNRTSQLRIRIKEQILLIMQGWIFLHKSYGTAVRWHTLTWGSCILFVHPIPQVKFISLVVPCFSPLLGIYNLFR